MKCPDFNEEKILWEQGYKNVAGLDEAGRGPLAGPVVAAAVILNPKHEIRSTKQIQNVSNFEIRILDLKVQDSKLMTEKQRKEVYEKLIKCKDIKWGVGVVSEKIIDKVNILEATKLAMKKALVSLRGARSLPEQAGRRGNLQKCMCTHSGSPRALLCPCDDTIDFLLIDGNFGLDLDIPQKSVIGGDEKVFSIAAASIIAKVTRDRLMKKYHKKYPSYGFDRHKGYGTAEHFARLSEFGPCKLHRKTFYPVSTYSQV